MSLRSLINLENTTLAAVFGIHATGISGITDFITEVAQPLTHNNALVVALPMSAVFKLSFYGTDKAKQLAEPYKVSIAAMTGIVIGLGSAYAFAHSATGESVNGRMKVGIENIASSKLVTKAVAIITDPSFYTK